MNGRVHRPRTSILHRQIFDPGALKIVRLGRMLLITSTMVNPLPRQQIEVLRERRLAGVQTRLRRPTLANLVTIIVVKARLVAQWFEKQNKLQGNPFRRFAVLKTSPNLSPKVAQVLPAAC